MPSTAYALQDPINGKQMYIIAVSVGSVTMWCFNSVLQQWFGEMGIIAILPMIAFYGFGILDKVGAQQPPISIACSSQLSKYLQAL